jgi:predicted metalloprotease
MRWQGRRESENVEDRRGEGSGGGFGGIGGGLPGGGGMRFPIGRGGGVGGIGFILVLLFLGWLLGINPLDLLNGTSSSGSFPIGQEQGQNGGNGVNSQSDEESHFVATVLADTEDVWQNIFSSMGKSYQKPTLVLFNGETRSGCGEANAATGPFYCPNDRKVYIDLRFYHELRERFKAPGDFAEAYVIAHEVGHHVQNLLGTLPEVDKARTASGEAGSNRLSVRLELQADCYAGIFARAEEKAGVIETGDIDEALRAAAAVGDDNLQRQSQGYVVPDTFTHGSSEQRSRWFKRGYNQGNLQSCDTFTGQI